jgi:hypothetical protein
MGIGIKQLQIEHMPPSRSDRITRAELDAILEDMEKENRIKIRDKNIF